MCKTLHSFLQQKIFTSWLHGNHYSSILTKLQLTTLLCVILLGLLFPLPATAAVNHKSENDPVSFEIANTVENIVKLNPPLVSGGQVRSYQISPDGSRVIYIADQETDEFFELYSVSIGGGTPVNLSRMTGEVMIGTLDFYVSPDSRWVIYMSSNELYSVPIEGGNPIRLDGPPGGGSPFLPLISSDSRWVVYLASGQLYSIPIEGGNPVKLNGALVDGGGVGSSPFGYTPYPAISPDSSRVVYAADQDTNDVFELYSVPIGGGMPVKLNTTFELGREVRGYQISPDSSRVIYVADQATDDVFELYSVSIDGGPQEKLSDGGASWSDHLISQDSSRVIYLGARDGATQLFSVPIEGGTITQLNGSLVAGGDVSFNTVTIVPPKISADQSQVVYLADQETDDVFELYSVPINGGASTKLNGPLAAGPNIFSYSLSPDSRYVVYDAAMADGNGVGLYSVPIEGGTITKLSDSWVNNVGHSGDRVVYMASPDLYSVPITGGDPIKHNAPRVGGGVRSYGLSPDGSRLVYWADQETSGVNELYSTFLATGLTIEKSVNTEIAQPGDPLIYSIQVSASDGVASVVLTDTLPTGVRFERSANSAVTYDSATHQLRYSGLIEPDTPLEIIYTAQVEEDTAPGSPLYSEVMVSGLNQQYVAGAGLTIALPDMVPTLNLIYANGDNDLASEVQALFQKAETAADNSTMTTLLLFDGAEEGDAFLYRLQPDENLAESCPSKQNPTCDGRYQEGINMWRWGEAVGSHTSLVEFLVLAMQAYPSEQVTLSLVGHGGGWSPDLLPGQPRFHSGQPTDDPLGGLLWDLHPTSSLSTSQLGGALEEVVARTGRKIDLLYLDACLMAMSEVAYEVRNSVHYLLASENWSWTSFRYNDHLRLDGNLSAKELGQQWLAHEADYLRLDNYPFTYSLLDLSVMDTMLSLENNLANTLSATLPQGKSKIIEAFRFSDCFDGDQDYELLPTDTDDYYCDLGSFAQKLQEAFGSESEVGGAAQELLAFIDDQFVLDKDHHNGRPWMAPEPKPLWSWSELGGVSKYMPLGEDDWKRAYYTPAYLQSAADGTWDNFLSAYWESATPPAPLELEECLEECSPRGPAPLMEEDVLTFLPIVVQ